MPAPGRKLPDNDPTSPFGTHDAVERQWRADVAGRRRGSARRHEHDPAEHRSGVHPLVSQHGLVQRQHLVHHYVQLPATGRRELPGPHRTPISCRHGVRAEGRERQRLLERDGTAPGGSSAIHGSCGPLDGIAGRFGLVAAPGWVVHHFWKVPSGSWSIFDPGLLLESVVMTALRRVVTQSGLWRPPVVDFSAASNPRFR